MAWSFVGVSSVVQVTATAHTLTLPAGTADGDLLVAVISSRIASTTSISLPAGWTLVAESKTNNVVAAATTSEASGMMAYIVRGASAPALTFTHPTAPSVAVGRIVAYRGQAATSPFDVGVGAKTGTAITAVSTAGLTTAQANELIVKGVCSGRASAFSAHDAATDPTTSSGTNSVQTAAPIVGTWQERQDASTTTGADTALAIADAIRGTAGATGNLTCTASVSGGHVQVAGAFKMEPEGPAVTFDAVGPSSAGATINGTSLTWSHTASGTDRFVLVGVSVGISGTHNITSVTYGGEPMTSEDRQDSNNGTSGWVELFSLVNPPTGAQDIVVTKNAGAGDILGGSISFTGVDQTTPLVTANENSAGGTANPISLTVASSVGNMVVAAACKGSALAAPTGSDMTGRILQNVNSASAAGNFSMSTKAGAASNTLTYANADSEWWGIIGVDIKLSTGAAAVTGDLAATEAADTAALTGAVSWQATLAASEGSDAAAATGTVSAAPGTNEITQTGSALDFIASAANSGTVSSTITVPSDAQIVCVGLQGWCGEANYFTSMTFTKGGTDTAMTRVGPTESGNGQSGIIFYLVLPDTGTNKSLKYDWAGTNAPGETPMISVTFWKGIDTASPVRSSGASPEKIVDSSFACQTGTLTAQDGDLVVAFVGGDTSFVEGAVDTWLNLNAVHQCTNAGAIRHDGAWGTFPPSGNLVVGGATSSTISYGVCAAIVLKPAATGITGTLATTEAADVAAMTGTVRRIADLAATETVDVLASAGTVRWVAALSATETVDTAAMSGAVRWAATLTTTEAADAAAFLGNVARIANLATTEAPDVAALLGTTRWEATLATTEAADAAAFLGSVGWSATLAMTEAPDVGAFTGEVARIAILATRESDDVTLFAGDVIVPPTGDLATTEAADTAALIGTTQWQAALATTEAVDVLAFLGTTRWAATLATTEAPDVAAFVGTTKDPASGPLATVEAPDVGAFTGTIRWQATLAAIEAADVAVFLGATRWQATLAASEAPDVAAITGIVFVPVTGTLGATEAPDAAAFMGGVQVAGTLGTTEAPDVAALVGTTRWVATLATTEAPDTLAFLGATRWAATLATTEAPDSAALVGTVSRVATLAATEAPDTAALAGTMGWAATLTATEAADALAFLGGIYAAGPLAVTEAPDTAIFSGGIYATGILTTTEAQDTYAGLGTAFGAGVNANLEAIEPPDVAALTGQITGVAGVLAASEIPDAAALLGTIRWAGTLATAEAVDQAAFLGTPRWVATLATTEANDTAAMVGTIRWPAILATTEAPDKAALIGVAGALPEDVVLAAVEAADVFAFVGSTVSVGPLVTTETPDLAAFVGGAVGTGILDTTEAPDAVVFDETPPSIQEAPGSILANGNRRVRELMSSNQRLRCLKYPMPRPRDLLNTYGQREREFVGRRVRTLVGD